MISCLECGNRRSDTLNDADALVTENASGLASRDVTFEDMQVGTADGRFGDLHDGVRRRGDLRLGTVLQGLLTRALINEGFHQACGCGADCWFRYRIESHCLSSFR